MLATFEGAHIKVVDDAQVILAGLEWVFDLAVQLSEVWKSSGSHPDDEALFFDVCPLEFVHLRLWKVFEFVLDV